MPCYEIRYADRKKISEELSSLEKALVGLGNFRRYHRIQVLLEATNEVVPFVHEYGNPFPEEDEEDEEGISLVHVEVRHPINDSIQRVLSCSGFYVREISKKEYNKKTAFSGL